MDNVVKELFKLSFIRKLSFFTALFVLFPFFIPAFIKTIVISSFFTFIAILVILIRLPAWMFSGLIRHKQWRNFYDIVASSSLILISLPSGSVTFTITSVLTSFLFTMFLESYNEDIEKIKEKAPNDKRPDNNK